MAYIKPLLPQNRRVAAIEALAAGHSRESAAANAGISVSTLYAWLNDADFKAQVETSRAHHIDQFRAEVREQYLLGLKLWGEHIPTVMEGMLDMALHGDTPAVRLKASTLIMDRFPALAGNLLSSPAPQRDRRDIEVMFEKLHELDK